jgi:hypothetical protein
MAKKMLAAQMGIVFHTTYNGKSMDSLRASFNIDVANFNQTKDVWFRDASFVDVSGTATFTEAETKTLTGILSQAGRTFQSINPSILNRISTNETFNLYIKTFNNTKVRSGEQIKDTQQHTIQLIRWVEDRLNKEILAVKREDTKKKRIGEKTEVMRFFRSSATQLKLIFDLMNLIVDSKVMVVRKLETIKTSIDTFVRTEDGFKVTGPEGFVAVDRLTGGALKLIDRLEFAHQNFNAAKNWSK